MSMVSINFQRAIAIVFFMGVGLIGTMNLAHRLEFGLEVGQTTKGVFVSSIAPGSHAEDSGIRIGDKLISVDNQSIINQSVARWILKGRKPIAQSVFVVERAGETLEIAITPDSPFHIGFLILNVLLGLTFFVVGIVVWWKGDTDTTIRSFFWLNCLAGTAILLYSHENAFHPLLFHHVYSLCWLITYCLIPPALAEFLIRFSQYHKQSHSHPLIFILLYLPPALIFLGLSYTYHIAYSSGDPAWITRYETLFNVGFGAVLLIYFAGSLFALLRNYLRPISQAERDRILWLLFCTFIGLTPFFFLHKAPVLLGLKPLIPMWTSFALMLVVPIGWGMAVASFRMFRLEWALSRTIIYAITVALVLYLMVTAFSISIGYVRHKENPASLGVLGAIGVVLLLLAILGLIAQVRKLIDRVYYHDWYRYERTLQDLGIELSGSITERKVVQILTERLPSILRIDKAVLLFVMDDKHLRSPAQAMSLSQNKIKTVQRTMKSEFDTFDSPDMRDRLGFATPKTEQLGFEYVLPLVHMGDLIGILLMGKKLSGAPYSMRDHLLLETLSSYAGTALANLALMNKLLDSEKRSITADMAGGIAHEISNALSPLMGQAQLIELSLSRSPKSVEPEVMTKRVNMIVEMCNRIKRIAQNLNRISEPLHLTKETVSLNDIADETLQILSETAGRIKRYKLDDPKAKFRLETEFDVELPMIQADLQQLSQAFMNLIINASDAMEPQGHGILRVGTQFIPGQNSVIGYVEDTGPGIPEEIKNKMFQPYFTTKEKGKGTGLGLTIIRSIIEAHDGKLTVHSSEGHGTRVEFSLPIPNQISH